ncbi:MAG: glycoside hydrolase family 15 protein [Chloroflexia bacterium]|nr:glycoside hydrolase family 15 protein [Chloroflexia bacterium]
MPLVRRRDIRSSESKVASSPTDYRPIEDYGLIGDCHSAALVSSQGSIDWLCLPNFDSPSVFARILDANHGGAWSIFPTARYHASHHYAENTNVLETEFTSEQGRARLMDFMPVAPGVSDNTDAPRYVIRIVEGIEGETSFESRCWPRPEYGQEMPAFVTEDRVVTFGPFVVTGPTAWRVDAAEGAISCQVTLRPGERAAFTLQYIGDKSGRPKAPMDPYAAVEETFDYWRRWSAQCTYEGPYRGAVVRSALVLKLLTFRPTGAILAAPTTSLPEEIGGERNWDYRFTWIRDASFTLYALLLAGFEDEDDAFFEWIVRTVQLERTGVRTLYPISGVLPTVERTLDHLDGYRGSRPVRIGNAASDQVQMDVYGEVLDALYFAWQAGRYDPKQVWEHFRPLVDWVANNWQRPGMGIWEVRGGMRHFVYSKAMLWVALDRGVKIARGNDLPGDVDRWCQERDRIRSEVFERGWSEKLGAFKQSYEDDRLDASNLLLAVIGFVDGDDPRMLSTLDATLHTLVVDGLCYRYLDAPEGLSGSEATFVLCTFWLVDALTLAGREDEAQAIFEGLLGRASKLGLFAEEIDPSTGHHLGNFPQAFSHLGVINAAVSLAQMGWAGSVRPEHADAARAAGVGGAGQGHKTYSAGRTDGNRSE